MTARLEQIYVSNYPMVFRRVSRFLLPDDVEEGVQDVFLRVAQQISTFDERSSAMTWIYRIATNYCLNRVRDEKRHRELLEQWGEVVRPVDIGREPDERILLTQLWKQMDEELVEVGFYYYVDGMTQSEIADVVGVTERTIRNRLQRLTELGARLKEDV